MAASTKSLRRRTDRVSEHQPRQPQPRTSRLEVEPSRFDVTDRAPQAFGVWLTTDEACAYLRYTGKHRLRSLYKFIARNEVKTSRRSARRLLIARRDLDQTVERGGK